VAAVVARPERSVEVQELLGFARERLAPYKCPKRVVVVDELPVNHMGKVKATEVAKLVKEAD
jgi:acyl-coenzyme A synthetase/AMP-(fatty) acid ligase